MGYRPTKDKGFIDRLLGREPDYEEHKRFQYKDLLDRHIPPLIKELEENINYSERRLPPEHEIAIFYRNVLDTVQKLQKQIEKNLEEIEYKHS